MLGNRWHSAVKKTTFNVDQFAYESRSQGATSIYRTIAEYPGVDVVVEETLDGMIDFKSLIKSGGKIKQDEILELAVKKFEESGMTPAAAIALAVTKFPGLISKLLAEGAILHPGETQEDFVQWLDTLTISQIKGLVLDWYKFNLEDQVRPLVLEWQAKAKALEEEKEKAKLEEAALIALAATEVKPVVPRRPGVKAAA